MRRIPVLLALAFLASLFIFSCGTEKAEETKPEWKNNDNTVRIREPLSVKTLNPFLYRYKNESTIFSLIFQQLERFHPETQELVPEMIISPPVIVDITEGEFAGGQSFTYEILPDAAWDDGKPLTAEDVAFTLKVMFNPKLPFQRYWDYYGNLKKIEIDPTNPKRFTIYANNQYFLSKDAIGTLVIYPRHLYDPEGLLSDFAFEKLADMEAAAKMTDERLQKFADEFTSPKYSREIISGSGPYRLAEWVEDQKVVLVKKENWWGEKYEGKNPFYTANPDTLIFIPIPDQTAAIAALNDESVDIAWELDPKQFVELRESEFAQEIYDFITPNQYVLFYTALNNRNSKLADKRVRRALAHVLDIDGIIETVYDGLGSRIAGPFFPSKPYYEPSLELISQDFEKARKLLSEAGWEDSNGNGIVDKEIDGQLTELRLTFLYTPTSNFQVGLFQATQAGAKKVGIDIQGEQAESNVKGQRLRNGDYEMTGHGARALPVPDDPKQLWHTDGAVPGGSNYPRFGNAQSDELIEKIRAAESYEAREVAYKEFQKLVHDEQPVIFLFAPQEKIAVHKRFTNVISNELAPGVSLRHLKLKTD